MFFRILFLSSIFLGSLFFGPGTLRAQEIVPDKVETLKGRVLEVVIQETKNVPGTDVSALFQKIKVEILRGDREGHIVTIDNDYLKLKKEQVFYFTHTTNSLDGTDRYAVSDPDRLPALIGLLVLFIAVVVLFGGVQGVRGLVALALSIFFIFYLLVPGVLAHYSPLWVSIGVASLIIILGSYITHGFNKTTSVAVGGMIITIIVTGVLTVLAVKWAQLTGFSSEESIYLNFDSRGKIDFGGLLIGGMIIGFLGVLYDAAIGQAIAVEELLAVSKEEMKSEVFWRALRIGREHIGALVNTLAIAYVGASLPLLLLASLSSSGVLLLANKELFATEIVRSLVGSIGLVLAVPITTLLAVYILGRRT